MVLAFTCPVFLSRYIFDVSAPSVSEGTYSNGLRDQEILECTLYYP